MIVVFFFIFIKIAYSDNQHAKNWFIAVVLEYLAKKYSFPSFLVFFSLHQINNTHNVRCRKFLTKLVRGRHWSGEGLMQSLLELRQEHPLGKKHEYFHISENSLTFKWGGSAAVYSWARKGLSVSILMFVVEIFLIFFFIS